MAYMSAYNNESQFNSCADNVFYNLNNIQNAAVTSFVNDPFYGNYFPENELKNLLLCFIKREIIHNTVLKCNIIY